MTIEEKASKLLMIQFGHTFMSDKLDLNVGQVRTLMMDIATSQDRIARKEERERCIEKAWEFFLHNMGNERNQVMTKFVDDDGEIVWRETYEDDFYDMLRKAIEEGGEE